MKNSYSNDEMCLSIDIVNEFTEEVLDALLNDSTTSFEISRKINDLVIRILMSFTMRLPNLLLVDVQMMQINMRMKIMRSMIFMTFKV